MIGQSLPAGLWWPHGDAVTGDQPEDPADDLAGRLDDIVARMAVGHQRVVDLVDDAVSRLRPQDGVGLDADAASQSSVGGPASGQVTPAHLATLPLDPPAVATADVVEPREAVPSADGRAPAGFEAVTPTEPLGPSPEPEATAVPVAPPPEPVAPNEPTVPVEFVVQAKSAQPLVDDLAPETGAPAETVAPAETGPVMWRAPAEPENPARAETTAQPGTPAQAETPNVLRVPAPWMTPSAAFTPPEAVVPAEAVVSVDAVASAESVTPADSLVPAPPTEADLSREAPQLAVAPAPAGDGRPPWQSNLIVGILSLLVLIVAVVLVNVV